MPDHFYPSIGRCIYCGAARYSPRQPERKLGDEHIIPLAMDGHLILPEASCEECERTINRGIETPITNLEWGYFRSKRKFPTRNKKNRKTHIQLRRKNGSHLRVEVEDYSCPVLSYKFGEARILSGLPPGTDHLRWTAEVLTDHDAEIEMKRRFPDWDGVHRLKTRPYEFARLIAKIGYSYAVAELGLGAFTPFVTEIILGKSEDWFYAVGGSWEIEPPVEGGGHITGIDVIVKSATKFWIRVNMRFFSAVKTPSYHVIVGEIDLDLPEQSSIFEKHRLSGKITVGRIVDMESPNVA
jgi:hypothetical protein